MPPKARIWGDFAYCTFHIRLITRALQILPYANFHATVKKLTPTAIPMQGLCSNDVKESVQCITEFSCCIC